MSNVGLAIGLIEAENRDELKAAATAEEKLRIAFKAAKDHWMFTDEEDQVRGAIGAAMHHMTPEDREIIQAELRVHNALGAATRGIPVDFSALAFPEKTIGIMKLWREAKAA